MKLWQLPLLVLIVIGATFILPGCTDTPPPPAAASIPVLPKTFTIQQQMFTWGHVFDIKDGDRQLATVQEQLFTWGRTFEYLDNSGCLVATGHDQPFTWGAQMTITDGYGRAIGTLKEEVFQSLFNWCTTYDILDGSGKPMLKSEKTEFFSLDFQVKNHSGQLVATITRPAFNWWGHQYTVTTHSDTADSRILVMIAAFKTAADADAADSSSSSSHH